MAETPWSDFEKYGFRGVVLQQARSGKVTLLFNDGVAKELILDANNEKSEFDALQVVPKEWGERGVTNVHVSIVDQKATVTSQMQNGISLVMSKDYPA